MTPNSPMATEQPRKHGRDALGGLATNIVAANQLLAGVHGRS
jgi:hypothetical protein